MEKPQKLKNQITVRISLGFQDAPDIHTLLAMTPVRERRKLILHALENYIEQSHHPSGDVPTQLEIIGNWLKERKDGKNFDDTLNTLSTDRTKIKNLGIAENKALTEKNIPIFSASNSSKAEENQDFNAGPSQSLNRWLSS